MKINPLTAIDFYKADHRRQYPEGTTKVYANFTPRSNKLASMLPEPYANKIVFFGLQYFIKHFLIESWSEEFFNKPKWKVVEQYKRRMDNSLGKDAIDWKHIADLHDLGYLPLRIKALPEGSLVPIGVPVLTIANTHPHFFWLTNYIETILSCYLWKAITSATIAYGYKQILMSYALRTGADLDFIKFQAHDFSFRGMSSLQDAALSGLAHLISFCGTDSVPAIDLAEDYYNADAEKGLIGCSVPATEHSVMCMGQEDGELNTFKRLITEVYPKGIVSIVSDTWDFWKVITEYMRELRTIICDRDGKVVIRPDSGDPVKIICGDLDALPETSEYKGAAECLWDIFGGSINEKGYKVLDEHIGLIYGDSITPERADLILHRLAQKQFCSSNIVFGIGSYTYQYVTRDTFGFAVKATSGEVNGEQRNISKNPKTDSGIKKSASGLLRVEYENNSYVLYENQEIHEELCGELKVIFIDGTLIKEQSLADIRKQLG